MLVLKRKIDQVIVVTGPDGSETRVTLVDVDRTAVRLGFTAPPGVTIDRLEVYETKKLDQKELTDADAETQEAPRHVCGHCGKTAHVGSPCRNTAPVPSYHPRPGG